MSRAIVLLLLLALAIAADPAPIDVWFVRHAQVWANINRRFADLPPEQRPKEYGNYNIFTEQGEAQVAELAPKFAGKTFDLIAVSPLWRTQNTIRPYLLATGRKAEIWPELLEITPSNKLKEGGLSPGLFTGRKITIADNMLGLAALRQDAGGEIRIATRADVDAVLVRVRELSISRIKPGGSILLVTHAIQINSHLKMITGQDYDARNACLSMIRLWPDGSAKLMVLNDQSHIEKVAVPMLDDSAAPVHQQ